jgi:hypothetical protein
LSYASSIIWYSKEHNVLGNWMFPSSRQRVGDIYSVCPLKRANLNHWTTFATITATDICNLDKILSEGEIIGKFTLKTVEVHVKT